jgi:hypothetical protein
MSQSSLDTRLEHGDVAASRRHSLLYTAIPYIAVLLLTILGVAYTSVAKRPLVGYWEMLAAITGAVCVIAGWPHAHTRDERVRLVWTQALHWIAFLVAMNLVLVSDVQRLLNADATGVAVLLLLALGTFVAGVHTLSWQTCVLGLVMALGVPIIAWVDESALVLALSAIAVVVIGGAFLWLNRRRIAPAAQTP